MSVENKYFTPDIEDIRVGYECEMKYRRDGEWEKFVVKDTWFGRDGEGDLPDVYSAILPGLSIDRKPEEKIRVPYLTKEQIEAEGWKYEEKIDKFKHPIEVDIELYLDTKSRWIWLTIPNTDGGKSNMYRGECKDINIFRYICKLLKIN